MSGGFWSALQACGQVEMHHRIEGTLYACGALCNAWWLLVWWRAYLAAHDEVVRPKRMVVLCHAPHPLHQQCHIHHLLTGPQKGTLKARALDLQICQSSHERHREPVPSHQCGSST